ncbi:hypothetical protein H257_05391 [Aphanomyces astaci]|uniref:Uncharacterized protein n=1 Tax=Aphanomyces astaci TaxID=112090 RepID=W4GR55_APHAT|nr:hypothetical protein H257_05391 [Aphanomyces astaci]ETV81821.1 hypothetical protein H257_05391 [Aphanomyces astaci]|eukprot:XP_009828558.1 hypothetical protein H257_05391 [Aphanomyces astaci]
MRLFMAAASDDAMPVGESVECACATFIVMPAYVSAWRRGWISASAASDRRSTGSCVAGARPATSWCARRMWIWCMSRKSRRNGSRSTVHEDVCGRSDVKCVSRSCSGFDSFAPAHTHD